MQAGKLCNRITIQEATRTADDCGQLIPTWSDWLADEPARVDQVAGGEVLRGKQVSNETQIVFTVRYRSGVTPRMRVSWGGTYYGIVAAFDPYGRRRELRIEAHAAE